MRMTDQLIKVAKAYCEARGLSLARVSVLIFNDGKKLKAIEEQGVDLSTGKFEFAMQWFSTNWPEEAEWPEEVGRPFAAADLRLS